MYQIVRRRRDLNPRELFKAQGVSNPSQWTRLCDSSSRLRFKNCCVGNGRDRSINWPSNNYTDRSRAVPTKHKSKILNLFQVVPERGVEPPHPCEYTALNRARLPFRHSGILFYTSILSINYIK